MRDYIITRDSSDYLQHFGIKGQKWGIRRFENPDGTLTAEGKKRYGVSDGGSGNSRFAKKYEKSVKKLQKLREQTDQLGQAKKALEYDKKAKTASRIGKAAAAIAIPAFGIGQATDKNTQKYLRDSFANGGNQAREDVNNLRFLLENGRHDRGTIGALNRAIDVGTMNNRAFAKAFSLLPTAKESATINPIANAVAVGAGLAAVTAFGKSAYDRVKSNVARKYASDAGHAKAVERYKQHTEKMIAMFSNTPYEALTKQQINEKGS